MSEAGGNLKFSADQDVMEMTTPLDQTLLVRKLSVSERISEPYRIVADVYSAHPDLEFGDLLGEKVAIHVALSSKGSRYFQGVVSKVSQGATIPSVADHMVTAYQLEVRPAFWFLRHTKSCRIFSSLSVVEMLETIFKERQALEFEFQFDFRPKSVSSIPIEYCVQYNESDFDFCSRKMEEFGLGYYFEQEEDGHKMVVFDRWGQHKPCPSDATAQFWPIASGENEELDIPRVTQFDVSHSFHAATFTTSDYDPLDPGDHTDPGGKLLVTTSLPAAAIGGNDAFEEFSFPGNYTDREEHGQQITDQFACASEQESFEGTGESSCSGFVPGFTFELTDHPRGSFNNEYFITGVEHSISQPVNVLGETEERVTYEGRFSCLPHKTGRVPFVPSVKTPRPKIEGVQSAMVVSQKFGSAIDIDEQGRVFLKFPWDRSPDTTSTRVRLSQSEAGKGWGTMAIPHDGHEVLVGYLNGDPDRPVVVGRVYNAANPPSEDALKNTSRTELRVHQGVAIKIEGGSTPTLGSF